MQYILKTFSPMFDHSSIRWRWLSHEMSWKTMPKYAVIYEWVLHMMGLIIAMLCEAVDTVVLWAKC